MKAYLRWHWCRLAAAAGWPGLATAFLLAACAMLQLQMLPTLRARNAALAQQLAQLPAARPAQTADHAALAAALPPMASTTQSLAALYGAAARHGLQLEQGDYASSTPAGSGITQIDIALPLNAAWPQLHGFIGQALADLPHAALAGLRLARQKSDAPQLDAQLRFRLFMRTAP